MATLDLDTMIAADPQGRFRAIIDIYHFSLNFEVSKGTPFQIFLDLIGYSEDVFGCKITPEDFNLGYLELDQLADALKQYVLRPTDADDFIDYMLGSEVEE